ncbi:MAG: flagellar protein FlgN, partial [Bdellovibrionaceae bacterium]|nr:flagellar protein FlgN [Pseudobdellovibrionaceae bacterium]
MKQKAYEKLIQNLDEIVKQYRLLLDSVRKEKELLIKSDIAQLNENNERKEQFIAKIKSLDDNRLMFASDLAQAIGADHLEPRLLQLAQKMGGAEGDRLRTMHSTLELLITRLMTLNK